MSWLIYFVNDTTKLGTLFCMLKPIQFYVAILGSKFHTRSSSSFRDLDVFVFFDHFWSKIGKKKIIEKNLRFFCASSHSYIRRSIGVAEVFAVLSWSTQFFSRKTMYFREPETFTKSPFHARLELLLHMFLSKGRCQVGPGPRSSVHSELSVTVWLFDLIIWRHFLFLWCSFVHRR